MHGNAGSDDPIAATDAAVLGSQFSEQEQLLRLILDQTADTIVRFDRDLRYDYVNDRTVAVIGRDREEWIGRTQAEMGFNDNDVALRERRLRRVFESGEPATYEDQIGNVGGSRWYESQLLPQFDADGAVAHVLIISRDVTDRRQAEDELVRAARIDPLTGLANRVALVESIDRSLAAATGGAGGTAVLLVDLDHFKDVNDSLGHAVGDRLLVSAGERLRLCVRRGDLVARHGGDEFVVLMTGLDDLTPAQALAERILGAFRLPLISDDHELSTTASVGISHTFRARSEVGAHDLIREADTAMYVAKHAGRDGVALFDEKLHARVDERLRIANELRGALDRGELAVWYQPEIDLLTGEMRAVEALLRWHHPSGELYPAGRFIDVATDTGLIVDIGVWVVEQAAFAAARWADRGIDVRFNLAPRQLNDPELIDQVDRAIEEAGVDPSRLCAEITESSFLHDTAITTANLVGLRSRNIALAIDDFGTGYASLTYLHRYPIDVVKIDRSFITHLVTSDHDRKLTAAIVALADQLDMFVTAEGVEHPGQAEVLRGIGCQGAQGFLYSPAVPADEIDQLLSESPWVSS